MFNSSRYVFARISRCVCLAFFRLTSFQSSSEWVTIGSVNSIARAIYRAPSSVKAHTHTHTCRQSRREWCKMNGVLVDYYLFFSSPYCTHTNTFAFAHNPYNNKWRIRTSWMPQLCTRWIDAKNTDRRYVHDAESRNHMHLPHGICCKSLKLNDRW